MEPKIVIEFDNPSKSYEPSDIVDGRVIIISTGHDDTILAQVTVRLEGRRLAFANPTKTEEFYFCEKQLTLIEHETILPKDSLIDLPFQFQLPSKLPSSFRVKHGQVDYSIVVKLRRNSDFDISQRSPFAVSGVYLLNPGDACPTQINVSKPVGCCSCFNWRQGHRFGFMVKLDKDQFLPGDGIDYTIKIWNSSKVTLTNVKIELIRELRLLDSGNYSQVLKESETLCSVIGPVVKPGEKLRWTSLSPEDNANNNQEESINTTISNRDRICTVLKPSVLIPNDVPPTHLGCLAVVQLDYFLKISMKTGGVCSSKLSCKCPIVIGSNIMSSALTPS